MPHSPGKNLSFMIRSVFETFPDIPKLLVSTDDSVLTIAVSSGFDNLSYFNRLFKREFHMTPREYRRQQ